MQLLLKKNLHSIEICIIMYVSFPKKMRKLMSIKWGINYCGYIIRFIKSIFKISDMKINCIYVVSVNVIRKLQKEHNSKNGLYLNENNILTLQNLEIAKIKSLSYMIVIKDFTMNKLRMCELKI